MRDYSEIMQDISRLQHERDDALRYENWYLAIELTVKIATIDSDLYKWLDDKLTLNEGGQG
jgi:hypothetical protein